MPNRFAIVDRQRLLDQIDGPDLAPVTLISAPAGYGKSTIATQWVAHHANLATGWHQVRSEHNTVAAFLQQLWRTLDAATGDAIEASGDLSIWHVLERLRQFPDRIVLVLDDFHLIENQVIHAGIELLIRDLPANAHLFILSRQLPDLALARLRMHGRLRHLTRDDLVFTYGEVQRVFEGFAVSDRLLRELTRRSEGWIAGLRLVSMSVDLTGATGARELDRLIVSMPDHRLLNDYIVEEVLAALPEDVRRFVFDTVVLDALEPALCDAVVQIDTSEQYLDRLERAIVFVSRPGGFDQPLSYHRLFAECVQRIRLRAGIDPRAAELSLRASRWYCDRGQFVEAAKYALAAEAWDEASEHMSRFLHFDSAGDNVWDTIYWVSQLPEAMVKQDVRLLQSYITAILAAGRMDDARRLLGLFLRIPGFQPTAEQLGWHANQCAFLAFVDGDGAEALYQSYRALANTPWEDPASRLFAWTGIYRELAYRGEPELADMALQEGVATHRRLGVPSIYWHFLMEPAISNVIAMRGDLAMAEASTLQFLRDLPPHLQITRVAFEGKLLAIYVEQGRLDLARAKADVILQDVEESNRIILQPAALFAVANYRSAIGETDSVIQTLERAEALAHRVGSRELIRGAEAEIAQYWLRTGQIVRAQRWADRTPPDGNMVAVFGEIEPTVIHAQLLMHQDRLDDARALLAHGIGRPEAQDSVWSTLQMMVWSAALAQRAGDDDARDAALLRALELGAPGRFVQVYSSTGIDFRPAIRALLPRLSPAARAHAKSLAGEPAATGRTSVGDASLTNREREVLAELLLGKSNREISAALFISERTVKKHLTSLFEKTGATNRMALALWGREHLQLPMQGESIAMRMR